MFNSSDSTHSAPMFSASSATFSSAATYSPPTVPYSPSKVSYSSRTPSKRSQQQNIALQDKLWLPQPVMYAEQHRFQQHHHQHSYRETPSNQQFQFSPKQPAFSRNLDSDSIMKVHDDLPSAAIMAWERLKAKNARLSRK